MRGEDINKRYKTGFVAGSFDLFHIGHLKLIRRAKEHCDYLIAGVLNDEVIYKGKGKWPVIPLHERMEIVSSIRQVDRVGIVTEDLLPRHEAQRRFGFDAFFTGDDHFHPGSAEEERLLNELGADLIFFPYSKEQSSTEIQQKILPPVKKDASRPGETAAFKYVFPFDKVSRGERIVLYGTGDVAVQYFGQLSAINYCQIVAFTDSACFEKGEFLGVPLVPPERLKDGAFYDRIVIASFRYFDNIAAHLRKVGVPGDRVV